MLVKNTFAAFYFTPTEANSYIIVINLGLTLTRSKLNATILSIYEFKEKR